MRMKRISMRAPKWMFSADKYNWTTMQMKAHEKRWPKAVKSKNYVSTISNDEMWIVRLTWGFHFRTFCIIKSHAIRQLGEVLKTIKDHDFIISNCAMVEIDSEICSVIVERGNPGENIVAGVVVALELVACDAVRRLQKLLGEMLEPTIHFQMSNCFWWSCNSSVTQLHRRQSGWRIGQMSWNRTVQKIRLWVNVGGHCQPRSGIVLRYTKRGQIAGTGRFLWFNDVGNN